MRAGGGVDVATLKMHTAFLIGGIFQKSSLSFSSLVVSLPSFL